MYSGRGGNYTFLLTCFVFLIAYFPAVIIEEGVIVVSFARYSDKLLEYTWNLKICEAPTLKYVLKYEALKREQSGLKIQKTKRRKSQIACITDIKYYSLLW